MPNKIFCLSACVWVCFSADYRAARGRRSVGMGSVGMRSCSVGIPLMGILFWEFFSGNSFLGGGG